MTRLVTLPNCRHNIVINTLFLKPEVMSGVNSIRLFLSLSSFEGKSFRLKSAKMAWVKKAQPKI